MNREEQLKALKTALDLETDVVEKRNYLSNLNRQSYRSKPEPPEKPVKSTVEPAVYPKVKSEIKYFDYIKNSAPAWLWLVSLFTGIFGILLILKTRDFFNARKQDKERIKVSDDYKLQCQAIDEEVAEKQAETDAQYNAQMEEYEKAVAEYENVIIPQYNDALKRWTEAHNHEIDVTQNALNNTCNALISHYEATRILPVQYRKLNIIQFLYDFMSTSNYDITQAIENYDKKVQRELEMARLQEQQKANDLQAQAIQLANEQNQLAYEQNELLDEQNAISERARRNANTAAVIGTIQRHNTNKALKRK